MARKLLDTCLMYVWWKAKHQQRNKETNERYYVRLVVLCQALESTALRVHPVLTAFAEDVVAAHSSVTDSTWELTWTLQEIQPRTTDHDLCLSCIYSQHFLLHCFFPCQEPSDTFLQWFSYDNKVVSIEVLPWDPTAELTWRSVAFIRLCEYYICHRV